MGSYIKWSAESDQIERMGGALVDTHRIALGAVAAKGVEHRKAARMRSVLRSAFAVGATLTRGFWGCGGRCRSECAARLSHHGR